MPTMPKQPRDAVLCRNGKVKLDGKIVGVWWIDGNDLYHFGFTGGQEWGSVSSVFRYELKTLIPVYLDEEMNKLTPST